MGSSTIDVRNNSIFFKLFDTLLNEMSGSYPELKRGKDLIVETLKNEEEKFSSLLDRGIKMLDENLANVKNKVLPGEIAFKLYDTYGFPLDLTELMASEKGKTVDKEGFESEMKKQKELAKKNQKFVMDSQDIKWKFANDLSHSNFIGYTDYNSSSKIINWSNIDLVYLSLPNGEAQKIIKKIYYKYRNIKFIDLSADFRITDPNKYEKNYKKMCF